MTQDFKHHTIEYFKNLKPFVDIYEIPQLPRCDTPEEYEEVVVKNLIRCGAIPKDQLEVGATYIGRGRGIEEGKWNGEAFEYDRCKFGMHFTDTMNHFQDDNGYALFVPLRKK
jgi:hypothetical protein